MDRPAGEADQVDLINEPCRLRSAARKNVKSLGYFAGLGPRAARARTPPPGSFLFGPLHCLAPILLLFFFPREVRVRVRVQSKE